MFTGVLAHHARISIHALLAESDGGSGVGSWPRAIFLSTLSLRRATFIGPLMFKVQPHFYPRSPCGERQSNYLYQGRQNPISIHALLAESDARKNLRCPCLPISIHALLAESDRISQGNQFLHSDFYPRSPCGERLLHSGNRHNVHRFLSTLSLRRATAKVHKTVGHFCAYETNFMGIASSC